MNMKLWIIIAISTLMVENKTDEFSINFKSQTDEFTIKANAIKATYWNVYVPDEADKQKIIPINYNISKKGKFKTILFDEIKMNEFVNFNDVNWNNVNRIKLHKKGESDILVLRNDRENKIILKQKRGSMITDNEVITIQW